MNEQELDTMDSFIRNCNAELFIQSTRYNPDNFYALFMAEQTTNVETETMGRYYGLVGCDASMIEGVGYFNNPDIIEEGIILQTGNTIEEAIKRLRVAVDLWKISQWGEDE